MTRLHGALLAPGDLVINDTVFHVRKTERLSINPCYVMCGQRAPGFTRTFKLWTPFIYAGDWGTEGDIILICPDGMALILECGEYIGWQRLDTGVVDDD